MLDLGSIFALDLCVNWYAHSVCLLMACEWMDMVNPPGH